LTQLQAVLGITASEVLSYKIDNLSVTTLDALSSKALTTNYSP
jgi:hypothetical protein